MSLITVKDKLSKREQEILALILEGKSNQDIADELFISISTIKTHIYNIYRKLGVRNRLQVINLIRALKRKRKELQDPKEINAQTHENLKQVIIRYIEKDKEKKYQTTDEILAKLTKLEKGTSSTKSVEPISRPTASKKIIEIFRKPWVIAALFVVVALAGMAFLYFGREKPVLPPEEKMLVVLPFENLGAPEDEYFADGITEEITSRLVSVRGLGVISRTSAIQYKNTNKTIKQIGKELGVDYVLEGTVRWNRSSEGKGQVRITPQLIRVINDYSLWAENYERTIGDIFSIQSDIAEEVAKQLDLQILEPERKALEAKPTDNIDAYHYYLRGIALENKGWVYSDTQNFEQALEMFEKATELDPDFVQAYVWISIVHSKMYFFGVDHTKERLARSRAAVDRAQALQPDHPDVNIALAFYYYWGLLDYDRAEEIFKSVQRARPNISPSLLGYIQRRQGKWEQAIETLEKAFMLNPRDSQLAYEIGLCYLSMHIYEKGEEWFNRALSINPDKLTPQLGKIGIHILWKGNTKEARALLETLPQHPLTDYMWFTLGMIERNYQEVLGRLASLSYDSFEEQHFYFHKNLIYASVYHAKKEPSLMKTHAESARIDLEKAVQEHPDDPRYHAALGLAYAFLGRHEVAVREGNLAVALYPTSKDAALGPKYVLNLARICAVVGEFEEAISRLEYLLSIPSFEYLWEIITVPAMRLDSTWDSLREHPRFQRLLKGNSRSERR